MSGAEGIWAVVPVKELSGAKQRLSGVFSPEFRRRLAVMMLSDVLSALALTRGFAGILVVTVDPTAKELAQAVGARILTEGAASGQTAAIEAAAGVLLASGASGMLTIPGDVPGVTPTELETLLSAHKSGRAFSIVPAHDRRGSNAIICSPPDCVPLKFGNDSFAPHVESARTSGIEPTILPLERIGLDIDNPEDLFAYAQKNWPTKTMSFLEHSGFWMPRRAGAQVPDRGEY